MSCLPEITVRLQKIWRAKNLKRLERKVEILNRKTTSDALFGCRAKFKKEKRIYFEITHTFYRKSTNPVKHRKEFFLILLKSS